MTSDIIKRATPETEEILGKYKHYKGNDYQLLGVAKHSETLEELIIYQALYGDRSIWVRPRVMFFEDIEWEGRKQPRFRRLP